MGVGPTAPVVERPQPGAADRHVGLPDAPRAPEAVGDHRRAPTACGGDRGPQVARRGVGILGQQDDGLVAGNVRGIDSRVGADQPPASRRSAPHAPRGRSGATPQHQLDQPGILAEPSGELERPLAGLDPVETAHASLGLRDHLLQRRQIASSSLNDAALRRARDQLAELGAGGDLGEPRQRDQLEFAVTPPRPGSRPAARVRPPSPAALGTRGERARQGGEVVGVSRSSASSEPLDRHVVAARPARSRWRSMLPSPKAGPMASAGARRSALVPVPWRSARPPPARAHPVQRRRLA